MSAASRREAWLDLRVAELAVKLGEVLELSHELSPTAHNALLAICSDVCAVLELRKVERACRGQASGPEEGGP